MTSSRGSQPRYMTAEEALCLVRSRTRVFVHTAAAAPQRLLAALVARAPELQAVEIVHLHTEGVAPYLLPEHHTSFHASALFVGANLREAVNDGRADYIPVFLSEVPLRFLPREAFQPPRSIPPTPSRYREKTRGAPANNTTLSSRNSCAAAPPTTSGLLLFP